MSSENKFTLDSRVQLTQTGVKQTTDCLGEITHKLVDVEAALLESGIRAKLIELGWTPPLAEMAKLQEPLAWTKDMPTEPGWYWIRHPEDHGAANMRHLTRAHGQWSFSGRLSSEAPPRGFSTRAVRIDVMWMVVNGCEFYGPLQVPT